MTKPIAVDERSRAEKDLHRRMYEYYVQIPESFYRQGYLELIRWLLDRVEPAHTVGIPVVRAALDSGSAEYDTLHLGPVPADDDHKFDELASMTERDLVGLPSYPGLTPEGMWMPTNKTMREDQWERSFRDIPTPSVLFPCHESGSPILDWVKKKIELSESEALSAYRKLCSGLLAGDKSSDTDEPSVSMNIRRGVELTAASQNLWATTAEPPDDEWTPIPEVKIFKLGPGRAAAFLTLFRVAALPGSDANLLCGADDAGNTYRLCVTAAGDLVLEVDPDGTDPKSVSQSLDLRTGEWTCALAMIKAAKGTVPGALRLHVLGHAVVQEVVDAWAMTGADTTFSIGGPHDASNSALAHHAYLAAWMGPQALGLSDKTLRRFWTALSAAYVMEFGISAATGHEGDQASWPVGGSPDPFQAGLGMLAAKYNRGQFPYAAPGRFFDGEGMVRDVRGFGCNRQIRNLALASEDLSDDEGPWTIEGGTASATPVVSPEALTDATAVVWDGTGSAYQALSVTGVPFVSVSCWVRREGGDDETCRLFIRDTDHVYLDPVPGTAEEFVVDGKWKRIVSVFAVPDGKTTADAGIERPGTTGGEWHLWGFQFTDEAALSPYAPNHRTETGDVSIAPASLLRFDPDRFPGFEDRGFVSFRVKPEELLSCMAENEPRILLDAYTWDAGALNPLVGRARVEILRVPTGGGYAQAAVRARDRAGAGGRVDRRGARRPGRRGRDQRHDPRLVRPGHRAPDRGGVGSLAAGGRDAAAYRALGRRRPGDRALVARAR